MAIINTMYSDTVTVMSSSGYCTLNMHNREELLPVLKYLLEQDNQIRVSTTSSLGQYIYKILVDAGMPAYSAA